jgi:cob(I)alamin adenosyltransferase
MAIAKYSKVLPPLQNFILPGGSVTSATLHVARTICRRAERRVIPLVQAGEIDNEALIYLNRLSDYLFVLARYATKHDQREETIYMRPDPRSKPYKPLTKDLKHKVKGL